MFVYRRRLIAVAAVLVLWSSSPAVAETWYLTQEQGWEQVSEQGKATFAKAEEFLRRGKLAKAVRSYDKFLEGCDPKSSLYAAALEKQFSIAGRFLAGQKVRVLGVLKMRSYTAGVKIMERICRRADKAMGGLRAAASDEERKTLDNVRSRLKKISTSAAVAIAGHYEQRAGRNTEYYELAYLKWWEIFETHEQMRKEALLAMARCRQAEYQGPKYDASVLTGEAFSERSPYDSARGCYQQFIKEYRQDAANLGIEEEMRRLNEEAAYKDLHTGRYYQRTGNRQAANLYYQMVMKDWPGTKAAEQAKERLGAGLSGEETDG